MPTSLQAALTAHLDARGTEGIFPTDIPALSIMRAFGTTLPQHRRYRPSLCIVAQGAKRLMVGDQAFDYSAMQALVVSFELPVVACVVEASPQTPFIGLALEFDTRLLREVMDQLDTPPRPNGDTVLGVFVETFHEALADCVTRLIRLLSTPKAIPVLYPAILRELYFWLLTGSNAGEVCKLALADSHTQRIATAVHVLRDDFARAISVGELASAAKMSPSSFHQHFKALTSMTPLQYQKQLRLLEARRLMLAGAISATSAAYQVGYESASQFSREYTRLFGTPPRRSIAELRGQVG
jgi:AraC-like DNA-binding protein